MNELAKSERDLRQLIICIPHLPYPELSPNSREHWAVKARAVRASREEVGWLAKAQWQDQKPMMRARVSYQFHVADNRKRDLDNLLSSCKAFQDGLIDAGVLFYDDAKHLEIGQVKVVQSDTEQTVIKLEELRDD